MARFALVFLISCVCIVMGILKNGFSFDGSHAMERSCQEI